ncbi:hypothetical protein A8926_3874 [Saccharopolyspora spinosa]|uniref:Uncharacterized protein n=1 Tax=Saccharopolyspora spinosa TaxID=60894 RepID=A0A2N3XZM6_SACSN|nr:hypothetical protein A8926_3874 [Saccharopolyspora spinosa]
MGGYGRARARSLEGLCSGRKLANRIWRWRRPNGTAAGIETVHDLGNLPPHLGNLPPHLGNLPPHLGNLPPHLANLPPAFPPETT